MAAPPPTTSTVSTLGGTLDDEEEVFCSDGLPPLLPRKPPVSTFNFRSNVRPRPDQDVGKGQDDADVDVLDEGENIDPVEAFEVFKGRLFISPTASAFVRGDGRSVASLGGTSSSVEPSTVETPLQRLTRLRMEITELEKDLRYRTNASEEEEFKTASESSGEWDAMTKVAAELSSRLKLAKHSVDSSVLRSGQLQKNLTASIRNDVQRIAKDDEGNTQATIVASGGDDALSTSQDAGTVGQYEARIARIEKAMGGSEATNSGGNRTILERLASAERMMEGADSATLELVAARAKVIRTDLEAAVKARSKLAHYSSTYNEDDVMTISSLYDQMKDIEGISRQLPTIVERLQQLALLHSQAADFSKRLSSVEEDARHNERICKSLESTFASLDKGLASNLSIIEANMEKLDNQMKDLVA